MEAAGHPSDATAAVGAALGRLPFAVEHLAGCALLVPPGENPVLVALQVIPLPDEEAVLNIAAPLIQDPVTSAVARVCANNGAPLAMSSAAMFQVYEGVDGHVYLGAVVRMPITAGIWQSGQLPHLLAAAVHSVAMQHDQFASFAEFCKATGQPYGRELYPACRTGYPRPMAVRPRE